MAKIVKTLTVSWQWSGDKYSLRGFNLAVTPTAKNPKEEVVATAFVETKEIKQTYSYKMGNVTLDKDAQYKIWVQAVYENSDSDWVATGGATVTDDGSATIITKTDREIQDVVNMASDNILTRQEKISLRREWQEIVYEFLEIESTAISQGIPSSNTAFSNFKSKGNALGTYLNGGTAWTISSNNKTSFPLWINDSNLGSNTSINGNTYRETFRVYYEAKVKILEEINKYKVNNVQVGGVNLLVGTATAKNTNVNAPTGYVTWDPYTTYNKQTLEQLGFKAGDKVTIGFDWSISKNGTNDYVYGNFRVEFRGIKSDGTDNQYLGTIKNPAGTFSSSNTKGRVEATVALDSATIKAHSLRFRIDNSVLNFKVSNLKMERGTKATGWSPALEEMENAYTIILTNEAQVIPTNSNRVPTSSTTYFTDIQVYKGTAQRNDYTIGTINSANGITVSKTSSRVNFAVSTNTALAADGGNFVIPITIDGKTFNKTFSWSCSKQGNTGASGVGISKITEYYAVSSSNTTEPTSWSTTVPAMTATNKYLWNYETITYSNNTTANTSKRVIGVYGDKGNTGATGATGNGISNIVNYYLATSSSSGVTTSTSGWTTSVQAVSASKKYLWNYEVITYTNGSTSTTTPCIIGAYGDTGATGNAGQDAITIVLSNENHTFPCESNGNIPTALSTTCVVTAYKGGTSVTPAIGAITNPTGMTITKNGATLTIQANTGTSLADSGTVNIPITVDGKTFNKTFTWSKAKKGATGATGATGAGAKTVDIVASSQVFKSTDGGLTFSPATIKLTPKLQNVTYSNWQYSTNGGSSWTNVVSGEKGLSIDSSNKALTVSKDSSLFTSTITSVAFRLNTNDSSVYDTITIVKLYDVADLEIGGRNLARKGSVVKYNSNSSATTVNDANFTTDGSATISRTAVVNEGAMIDRYVVYDGGANYVAAFKMRTTSGTVNSIHIFNGRGHKNSKVYIDGVYKGTMGQDLTFPNDTNYHKIEVQFEAVATDSATANAQNTSHIIPQPMKGTASAYTIQILNLKIEKGNKATDWTPAPEDVAANITDAKNEAINSANNTLTTTITNYYTKDETNSQINVAKEAINLGVSNTYETKANVETKITSTLNNAKSYADTKKNEAINTASSDATNKVNSAKNELNTAIGKKANSSDVYSKAEVYTKGQTDSAIKVAKDEINLGVSNTYETKANVVSKINDIKIGGTNLAANTSIPYTSPAVIGNGSNVWGNNNCTIYYQHGIEWIAGEPLTISFDYVIDWSRVSGITEEIKNSAGCGIGGGRQGLYDWDLAMQASFKTYGGSNTKGHFVYTGIGNGNANTNQKYFAFRPFRCDGYPCDGAKITISNFKVERGNKATEWSPSPLDINNNITTAKNEAINSANNTLTTTIANYYTKEQTNSQIDIAKEAINLGVSSTYETKTNVENKISSANTTTLNSAKSYADTKKSEAITQAGKDADSKVNSAKNDLNTAINKKANSTDVYTKSQVYTKEETNSQIKVAKDEINLGVSNTYETKANVETKINTAVNNVQVGSRNLIKDSNFIVQATQSAFATTKPVVLVDGLDLNATFLGKTVSFSYFVHNTGSKQNGSGSLGNRFGIHGTVHWKNSSTGATEIHYPFADCLDGTYKNTRVSMKYTFNPPSGYDTIAGFNFSFQPLSRPASGNSEIWKIGQPKLEIGTKSTDWSPAPEDVANNIADVKNSLNNFQNTVNTTFKDGIIEEAEAKAIAQHLKTLDAEKADIDKEYSAIYSNSNLTGPAKTNLASAKTSFDSAHASLKSTINTVISDGRVSSSESASVTSTFNTYNTQLGVYKQRVQEALDNISSGKVDKVEIGGRNLLLNSDNGYLNDLVICCNNINVTYSNVDGWRKMAFTNQLNNEIVHEKWFTPTQIGNYTFSIMCRTDATSITTSVSVFTGESGHRVVPASVENLGNRLYRIVSSFSISNLNRIRVVDLQHFRTVGATYVEFRYPMLEVGNKVSAWSQAPEDVAADINTAKNEAINSANNTLTTTIANYYTKEQTNSQINIAKEEINLGVSTIYETKESTTSKINNAVNNIKVGGTNLALNTNNPYTSPSVVGNGSNTWYGNSCVSYFQHGIEWIEGEPLTISFDYIIDWSNVSGITEEIKDGVGCGIGGADKPGGYTWDLMAIAPFKTYGGNNTQGRFVYTGIKDVITNNSKYFSFRPFRCGTENTCNGARITISNFKVERGNKATEWSPSPLDINNDITTAKNEAITSANNTLSSTISNYYTKAQTDSQINIAKEAINLGVSTTYETKSNVESKVSSTLNSAKSYADTKKSEAINSASSDATTKANNALNNAKSYADTKKSEAINSAATDATSKVNSAKSELNTAINKKANSADVYTKTEVYTKNETDSKITVAKNEINLGVSNTYETKTNVESKINNIKIGGTNLALNTSIPYTSPAITGNGSNTWSNSGIVSYYQHGIEWIAGEPFTISFDYVIDWSRVSGVTEEIKNNAGCGIGAGTSAGTYTWDLITQATFKTYGGSNTQGHFVYTGVRTTINNDRYFAFRPFRCSENRCNGAVITISNFKVERGNKATGWTPAPEDIENEITILESETKTLKESVSSLQLSSDSINASVKSLQETVTNTTNGLASDISSIQNQVNLAMTANDVKLEIQKEMAKGTNKVTTATGFTFNESGLNISKSDSEMSTRITEDGMKVYRNNDVVLTANNQGVDAKNLHATTYLIIGGNSRMESVTEDGTKRTAVFWIGS